MKLAILALRHGLFLSVIFISVIFITSLPARAELSVDSVAILANSSSPASIAVAEHYANKRAIPKSRIISLPLTLEETITRKDFDTKVVAPLRKELEQRGIAATTRVLVSTFDMPIRVASPDTDSAFHEYEVDALRRKDIALSKLYKELRLLEEFAKRPEIPKESLASEEVLVKSVLDTVRQLIQTPPEGVTPAALTKTVSGSLERISGIAGLLQMLKAHDGAGPAAEFLKQQKQFVIDVTQRIKRLDQLGGSAYRDTMYRATETVFGSIGVLSRAKNEISRLQASQAEASFDSELTLLWWDTDMYPLANRLPNPWFMGTPQGVLALPLVMVSRLDGPTAEIAKGLVDLAITAETEGLEGEVFVDARGLKTPGDQYFTYDQKLRDFGWKVRADTPYSVYIEDHEELLQSADDVALYVGWYSVGNFVGEFTFNTGAIGYHIASSEAISVRDPENKGWCKALLSRGIAATLGPVGEPYLDAFPEPEDFFGLMMTGDYTLVEAYYRSTRYISWQMVLFGDPLYRPWKKKPAIDPANLSLSSKTIPPLPSLLPFAEALQRRNTLLNERGTIAQELKTLLERPIATPPAAKPQAQIS
jgi:uncharacterized protein (TIGR03790 family)